jgi:hypothetical protein
MYESSAHVLDLEVWPEHNKGSHDLLATELDGEVHDRIAIEVVKPRGPLVPAI